MDGVPFFGIAYKDIAGESVCAVGPHNGHRQCHWSVGGDDDGAVPVCLFWKTFLNFDIDFGRLNHCGHQSNRREIGGGEKGGG